MFLSRVWLYIYEIWRTVLQDSSLPLYNVDIYEKKYHNLFYNHLQNICLWEVD
jgi:hypothetical protein